MRKAAIVKTEDLKTQILLAESGELSAADRDTLERRLASDSEARAYRDDLRRLGDAAREAVEAAASVPSPAVLARIREAAERRRARPRLLLFLQPPAVQALAYAALLAIVAGGWFVLAPEPPRGERIAQISAILAVTATGDEIDASLPAVEGGVEAAGGMAAETELRKLAYQLLHMEGLAPEERTDSEPWEEWLMEGAEPAPTTLRPRSIPELRAKRYV